MLAAETDRRNNVAKAYEVALLRYDAGRTSFLEVIDAQRQLLELWGSWIVADDVYERLYYDGIISERCARARGGVSPRLAFVFAQPGFEALVIEELLGLDPV